jgi:hypothetical protein
MHGMRSFEYIEKMYLTCDQIPKLSLVVGCLEWRNSLPDDSVCMKEQLVSEYMFGLSDDSGNEE